MANVIERIVRLVLDKRAAAKLQDDAKDSADKAASSFETRMGAMAKRVAGAIAAIFAGRAIANFLTDAVRGAIESEKAYKSLGNTVKNTGADFASLRAEIEALAGAFQDATVYGDEDFAIALNRLVTVTGNVDASLNNMGLVANVAAQFFNGELAPAVDLVGKVMNGLTTPLKRMGIEVSSAQEGLEVLAQRSMGAATSAADTFQGKIAQVNNMWAEFKEQIGTSILAGGEGKGALDQLIVALRGLVLWVQANSKELSAFASGAMRLFIGAIKLAVDVVDGAIGVFLGFTETIAGVLGVAIASAVRVTNLFASSLIGVLEVAGKLGKVIGFDGAAAGIEKFTKRLRDNTNAIDEWAQASQERGAALTRRGIGRFGGRVFSPGAEGKPFDFSRPPLPSGNGGGDTAPAEEVEKVKTEVGALTKALADYETAMTTASRMSEAMGDSFDMTKARVEALQSLLKAMAEQNDETIAPSMRAIADEIASLAEVELTEAEQAVADFNTAMAAHGTLVTALGDEYDALGNQARMLEGLLTSLAMSGMTASNPIMQGYIAQLAQIRQAMKEAEEQSANYGLAVSNLQSVLVGAIGGSLGEVAKAKAKENLILAAEQTAHGIVSALNPFTAGKAPGHFAAAAKFGAIAAAWSALGAASGGGGGGSSLAGAQGASGGASAAAQAPGQEVNIYLTGPGFDALNPEVQRVVYGAQQEARQRFGANASVNIVRRR
jgi:hypothetical protein